MKSQGPTTKLVRIVFTREQIFRHKGTMVVEVPSTMTIDELKALDNDELNVLPWKPLSEPEYGDEPDRDMVYVDTVEECSRDATSVDGVVTVDGDGVVRVEMP